MLSKESKVIISTGASTINEIKNALNILLKNNLTEKQITILLYHHIRLVKMRLT